MLKPKTVALISRADASGGGASRVADDIQSGLADDAVLRMERYIGEFSRTSRATHRPIVARVPETYRRVKSFLHRRGYIDHLPIELPFLNPGIWRADIVHAHDITTAMAPLTLHLLARLGRRVVWTLHDMSSITGGCIYPIACGEWRRSCGSCPLLDQWPFFTHIDRTQAMRARRRAVLRRASIELVAPSRWLAAAVEAATLGHVQVRVIPNGVDIATFAPSPAPQVERGRPTLLFIANHIRDTRKGGAYLADIRRWLEATNRRLDLSLVGSGGRVGEVVEQGALTLRYLGRFDDRVELAAAYRSAEGLLMPTHADNFPLAMLEAMACGRPVFAFDVGGIAEAVDESCGAVRRPGNIADLLNAFFAARDAGELPAMGAAARERAENHYSMTAFVEAHRKLYFGAH